MHVTRPGSRARMPPRRRGLAGILAALALGALALALALAPLASFAQKGPVALPFDHLIVIFLENHSFENLYGLFPGADGLAQAASAPPQVDLADRPFATLPQPRDTSANPPGPDPRFPADLPSGPFDIGRYVPLDQRTGDLIHAYYRQQYQINGGRNNRFAFWSDAKGLAMGHYQTSELPLSRWAAEYTLADRFFHAAFGGSYLNHFWLVCACTPYWLNPPPDTISIPFDEPAAALYPGAANGPYLQDRNNRPDGYSVNTTQPFYWPYREGTPESHRLPPQTFAHIGDRLGAAGVSWTWYAGGWNDAAAGHPDPLFQYHHQPFNYFRNVGGDPAARARHLKDESEFLVALRVGTLPQVAWIKPGGTDNEHPGYADVLRGEDHVDGLLRAIRASRYWPRVAVIVTYDEHGGFWDHVPPPIKDEWGPGLRVPAMVISPFAKRGHVDHTEYDTTSILRLIQTRWGLAPLGPRDAAANDLTNAFQLP